MKIGFSNEAFNTNEENNINLYHVMPLSSLDNFKKYGFCSPRKLYEIDTSLFEITSYQIYKERACAFLNKKHVTNEEVLYYLDNSPQRIPEFSSRSLFFSFLPLTEHHSDFVKRLMPYLELSITSDRLKEIDNFPGKVGPGKKVKTVTWKYLTSVKFMNEIKIEAAHKPPNYLLFKYVSHLVIDGYHIEADEFNIEIYKSI